MDIASYLLGKSNGGGGGSGALVPVVVQELPETGEAGKLYLVPRQTSETNNVFDEYIYINNDWEKIGTTDISVPKVYQINYNDSDALYKNYFSEWLDNYKNNIESIILVYYNYSVALAYLNVTYNNGNGTIKISTSYLNGNYDVNAYGIYSTLISANGREATITNDTISKVNGWYTNASGYIVKGSSVSDVLGVNNTKEYSVTNDYTPAHKKYVDDSISQKSIMPTASADNIGKIIQYVGETDSTYTNGYFYQVVSDGGEPATYSWENINVQNGGGNSDIIVIPKNSYYYTEELIEKVNGEYQKYLNNKPYNLYFQFIPDGQSDIVTVKGEFFGNVLRNAFTENDRVSSYYNRIVSAKCIFRFNGTQITGIQGITSVYIRYSNSVKSADGVLLAHNNQFEYTPSGNYNPATKKYVDELPKTYTGYDATKTQVLKNINGTLTWVDEE